MELVLTVVGGNGDDDCGSISGGSDQFFTPLATPRGEEIAFPTNGMLHAPSATDHYGNITRLPQTPTPSLHAMVMYFLSRGSADREPSCLMEEADEAQEAHQITRCHSTPLPESLVFCQICRSDVALSTTHQLASCGHSFCHACLINYMAFAIQDAQLHVTCCYRASSDSPCMASIPDEEMRSLVDQVTWDKYTRFKLIKTHKNARQCPYCDHCQIYEDAPTSTRCHCDACGCVFCFAHSVAHPMDISCSSHERRAKKTERQTMAAIHKSCKACPGCGYYVEKSGGCNQMKCVSCKTSFCWICRGIVDDSTFPVHFQWWTLSGCAGKQMATTDVAMDESSLTCERVALWVLRCLFFLVIGPPALLLAVVCSLLCCCCYPCTKTLAVSYREAFTSCLCVSGYVVLTPLIVAAGLLIAPCLCVAFCASPASFRTARAPSTATTNTTVLGGHGTPPPPPSSSSMHRTA